MKELPTLAKVGTIMMAVPGIATFMIALFAVFRMAFLTDPMGNSDELDFRLAGYAVFGLGLMVPGYVIYLMGMVRD